MDTVIEEEVSAGKRKKTAWIVLIILLAMVGGVLLLRFYLSSSLKKSAITTAVVEKGDIENTITASGEILPEFEEIITSPINASIQNVLLDAGTSVKAGQSVLSLDKS